MILLKTEIIFTIDFDSVKCCFSNIWWIWIIHLPLQQKFLIGVSAAFFFYRILVSRKTYHGTLRVMTKKWSSAIIALVGEGHNYLLKKWNQEFHLLIRVNLRSNTLEASSLSSSVVAHHSARLFASIWLTSRKEVAYVYSNLWGAYYCCPHPWDVPLRRSHRRDKGDWPRDWSLCG